MLTVALIAASLSSHPVFNIVAVLVAFVLLWGVLLLVGRLIFPPLFRLLSRLPDKHETEHPVTKR